MISVSNPLVILLVAAVIMLALLAFGSEIFFAMAASGLLCVILFWKTTGLSFLASNAYDVITTYTLTPLPLFLFMSMVLQQSGIAEDMFKAGYAFLGSVAGGLGCAIIIVCAAMGAMVGIVATGIVTMGVMAYPLMVDIGYDRRLSMGAIAAGGGLATLIPPSGIFILYGAMTGVSVGKLFAGGMIPGLTLAGLYMLLILARCKIKPALGPTIPAEERLPLKEKLKTLKGVALPVVLIVIVLGSIMGGIASPTESAALGALGSLICAAAKRNLNWDVIKKAAADTFRLSGPIMWVIIGAYTFKSVLAALGSVQAAKNFILNLDISTTGIVIVMVLIFMIAEMFMDDISLMMLTFPVFIPVLKDLGVDLLWFGVLFLVIDQIGAMSPPFGFCLFVLKSVMPKDVTMKDIWISVIPYIGCGFVMVFLMFALPQLATWLPGILFS